MKKLKVTGSQDDDFVRGFGIQLVGYAENAQGEREAGTASSARLDSGEAAHFAVFEGEVLASPGYGVSGEAPDPDAQGYYVASG
jgi:hypothetical protein